MPRPLRLEVEGGVYHVIARGNERKPVFLDAADRRDYLARLGACRERFGFFVYAYCLMANHIHLAIERGPVTLSRIMLALQSAYTQRFNRRHDRVGHLFQGRYKAFLVDSEHYLLALLRYIHRNPVVAALVARPEEYPWSSDRFYRKGRGPAWLDVDRVLCRLARKRSLAVAVYQRLVDGSSGPMYEEAELIAGTVRGDEDFAERVFEEVRIPSPRSKPSWTREDVAAAAASAEGLTVADLRRPGRKAKPVRARTIAAYLARKEAGIPVSRMAEFFLRDESVLDRLVLRLERAIERDASLRDAVLAVERSLASSNARMHG